MFTDNRWKNCDTDFSKMSTPTTQNLRVFSPSFIESIITFYWLSAAKKIVNPPYIAINTNKANYGVLRRFVLVLGGVGYYLLIG